jgi:hypothetical protein
MQRSKRNMTTLLPTLLAMTPPVNPGSTSFFTSLHHCLLRPLAALLPAHAVCCSTPARLLAQPSQHKLNSRPPCQRDRSKLAWPQACSTGKLASGSCFPKQRAAPAWRPSAPSGLEESSPCSPRNSFPSSAPKPSVEHCLGLSGLGTLRPPNLGGCQNPAPLLSKPLPTISSKLAACRRHPQPGSASSQAPSSWSAAWRARQRCRPRSAAPRLPRLWSRCSCCARRESCCR